MTKPSNLDTIAAIATPLGIGGIAVVRLSGSEALKIAAKAFQGRIDLEMAASHTAHFGRIVDANGAIVDEVVATVFRGPSSYTGESTVEISCHGGILVTKSVLEALLERGARHAEAGEFTKRAFLNGRLDLSQAEAVADLIHAQSSKAHDASIHQLEGALSKRVQALRSRLMDSIALLELELDFVEEDLEFINEREFETTVETTRKEVQRLMGTFKLGRIYREGIKVSIVGPPNAGKSSLLNSLLESNRAIVTDTPGTTRDTIEESVSFEGYSFRLVDTAGLRSTDNPIEKEGIRRTENEARNSDIILVVLDASELADISGNKTVRDFVEKHQNRLNSTIVALNKMDLNCLPTLKVLQRHGFADETQFVRISTRTMEGIDELQKKLVERAVCGIADSGETGTTITSARHFGVLQRTDQSLALSLESLKAGRSNEFIAVDLRDALNCLGEITGEATSDDILNHIFSRFCIGK